MSAAGPLCAVGFALLFAGLHLVLTDKRRLDYCALMALGAVMFVGGLALGAKGI